MDYEIKLTRGMVALVDYEDYVVLSRYKWLALKHYNSYVAARGVYNKETKKVKTVLMHRIITNCPNNFQVDHKNGNVLDNRKHNLRICTAKQNCQNRKTRIDNKLRVKGVTKKNNKFAATIYINKKQIWLGVFDTIKQATMAYNKAAIKYFGEFARTNKYVSNI